MFGLAVALMVFRRAADGPVGSTRPGFRNWRQFYAALWCLVFLSLALVGLLSGMSSGPRDRGFLLLQAVVVPIPFVLVGILLLSVVLAAKWINAQQADG